MMIDAVPGLIPCRLCAPRGTIRQASWVYSSSSIQGYTLCNSCAVRIGVTDGTAEQRKFRRLTPAEIQRGELQE